MLTYKAEVSNVKLKGLSSSLLWQKKMIIIPISKCWNIIENRHQKRNGENTVEEIYSRQLLIFIFKQMKIDEADSFCLSLTSLWPQCGHSSCFLPAAPLCRRFFVSPGYDERTCARCWAEKCSLCSVKMKRRRRRRKIRDNTTKTGTLKRGGNAQMLRINCGNETCCDIILIVEYWGYKGLWTHFIKTPILLQI